jgi:hypothetical protein
MNIIACRNQDTCEHFEPSLIYSDGRCVYFHSNVNEEHCSNTKKEIVKQERCDD